MSESQTRNFISLYESGRATSEEIDDYVAKWHQTTTHESLHDYLGMSWEEYSAWVKDPKILPQILNTHRAGRPLGGAKLQATQASGSNNKAPPQTKVLTIGREINLSGQITACDYVIVEGKVEAQLTDSRFLEVNETGQFKGSAEVEEAEIRGRFEGRLRVRGRLLIRGGGKVSGEITYGRVEIERGGEISGTVQSITTGAHSASSSSSAAAE